MNRNEFNWYRMYRAVYSNLNANITAVSTIPALNDATARFGNCLTLIKSTDAAFRNGTSGKTESKKNAKKNLVNVLFPLTKLMSAFAVKTKDEELKAICNLSRTKLLEMKELLLDETAETFRDKLIEKLSLLGDYNITQAKIDRLTGAISVFDNSIDTSSKGSNVKVADRKALTIHFDEADKILKGEIDSLMEDFAESNTEFYNQYKAARVIKDYGMNTGGGEDEDGNEGGNNGGEGGGSTGDGSGGGGTTGS
jgi:hypothetical protein